MTELKFFLYKSLSDAEMLLTRIWAATDLFSHDKSIAMTKINHLTDNALSVQNSPFSNMKFKIYLYIYIVYVMSKVLFTHVKYLICAYTIYFIISLIFNFFHTLFELKFTTNFILMPSTLYK